MGISVSGYGYPRPHYLPPIKDASKEEDESPNYKIWAASKSPFLLYRFLKEGDEKTLSRIADEEPKIVSEWANQAIFLKVKGGAIEGIEYLEKLGARIDATSSDGNTLLSEAVFAEQLEMVDYLLKRRAPLILDAASGKNVFHLACELGSVGIILRLLKEMDAKEGFEWLNFDKMSLDELLEVIPVFFEKGSILPSTIDRFNPILSAIVVSGNEGLLEALYAQLVRQQEINPASIPILPNQLLVQAYECFKCEFPDRPYPLKLAEVLVRSGVYIDSLGLNGLDTLYFRALTDGDKELTDFCKTHGASLNYKIKFDEDKLLFSRLEFEIGHRRYETVVMMMQNGALFSEIGETEKAKAHFWSQMLCDFFDQLKQIASEEPIKEDLLLRTIDRFIVLLKQIKIEIKSEGPIIVLLKKNWENINRLEGEDEEEFAESVDCIECLNEALVDLYAKGRDETGDQLLLEKMIAELSLD